MRKICILTYYNSNNYGSRLQSTALSIILNRQGYETYFLKEFKARVFTLRHPILIYARIYNRLNKANKVAFFTPVRYSVSQKRRNRLEKYTKEFYKELRIRNDSDWKKIIDEKTIFIAGSDIIWQPANGYPSKYFLDFAVLAGLPCFSYASSLGALSLPSKYYRAYRRYLSAYRSVGVRENQTVDMLRPIIGREINKVVDPTLLLTTKDWNELADRAEYRLNTEGPFIFCYFVMNDERYWSYVRLAHEATGLEIVVLPMHGLDEDQPYNIIKDGTPYEFIDLIRKADFILTDSFHTCVFSIIYQKEFYLMRRERKAEDAKYDDLLGRYNLENRIVSDESRFIRVKNIDYQHINVAIEKDREESLDFLRETLAKC